MEIITDRFDSTVWLLLIFFAIAGLFSWVVVSATSYEGKMPKKTATIHWILFSSCIAVFVVFIVGTSIYMDNRSDKFQLQLEELGLSEINYIGDEEEQRNFTAELDGKHVQCAVVDTGVDDEVKVLCG